MVCIGRPKTVLPKNGGHSHPIDRVILFGKRFHFTFCCLVFRVYYYDTSLNAKSKWKTPPPSRAGVGLSIFLSQFFDTASAIMNPTEEAATAASGAEKVRGLLAIKIYNPLRKFHRMRLQDFS